MSKKYNLYHLLFIFILGSLFHFIYEWSNENFFIGLISPTNESIFSHTKLFIIPTIIFYSLFYYQNQLILKKDKFFSSLIIDLVTSISSMILIYYSMRYGFNIESIIFDIFLFFLSILIGLKVSNHYYKYARKTNSYKLYLFLILLFMIIFTLNPLNYPFFH